MSPIGPVPHGSLRSSTVTKEALSDLNRRFGEIRDLEHTTAILGWDQEVIMPPGGAELRAQSLATLTSVIHERLADPILVEGVMRLREGASDLAPEDRRAVELAWRSVRKAVAVPKDLAVEFARTKSRALESWRRARDASDFSAFAPDLERILVLAKRIAEADPEGRDPYDAAIDEYEPEGSAEQFDPLLEELERRSVALLDRVRGAGRAMDTAAVQGEFSVEGQRAFVRRVVLAMGIDLDRGRLDLSTHPFCGGVGPSDVRMTGRYDPRDLRMGLFGAIHEAGHGQYEQGLDPARMRLPIGGAASMAIHESQSRLWENLVARSLPFWKHWIGPLRDAFPSRLEGVGPEDVWRAVNAIEPSLIRVEADELTYNLHIILRYRIERELFDGRLHVRDLPERWNTGMRETLGIAPESDAEGCLQDIHWSMGAFGYFPTYSLGNLYSAQFLDAARRDMPSLEEDFARGELRPLAEWLHAKIHCHDQLHTAAELVQRTTGEPLSVEALGRHLEQKVEALTG